MAIALFVVFMAVMIGIGIWGLRKTATLNDYMLGGRTIGPWMSALAYGTTYFSAVLFIGFAGRFGWKYGLWSVLIGVGNALFGALLAWLVLGRRTRRMTHNLDAMTMPEFLAARFESQYLKPLTAIIIFLFLLPYAAGAYQGLGYLFESGFGISFTTALALMTVVTGLYLVLGGYFAVALTDFIQGLIMFGGALVMAAILAWKAGGAAPQGVGVLEWLGQQHTRHVPDLRTMDWVSLGALVFMTSFGAWGMPQMVQKFYAIKAGRQVSRAAVVTAVFAAVVGLTAYFTGSLGHVFLDKPPLNAAGAADFDRLVPNLLVAHLPPWLMALVLLLVLSASMSTLAGLILIASSSVAIDLYMGQLNPQADKRTVLTLMRFLSAVFIALAYFIAEATARTRVAWIETLMSLSWGAVAGSFLAPYLLGLFWRRTSRAGVYAGIASALVVQIGLFAWWGKALGPVIASLAILVPFAVVPVVSLLTAPPSQSTLRRAFAESALPRPAETPAPVAAG